MPFFDVDIWTICSGCFVFYIYKLIDNNDRIFPTAFTPFWWQSASELDCPSFNEEEPTKEM